MIGGLGTGIMLNDWPTRSPATIRGTVAHLSARIGDDLLALTIIG
jgi:hypothetical protein